MSNIRIPYPEESGLWVIELIRTGGILEELTQSSNTCRVPPQLGQASRPWGGRSATTDEEPSCVR